MTHTTVLTPETEPSQVTPVQVRKLYREFTRKPSVYGSRFDLPEPIETETLDGRKLRILGIEVKEGCHERRFCLGHVYINWALQSGAYSTTVYAIGQEPAAPHVRRALDRAFLAAVAYLEAVEPAGLATTTTPGATP